MENETMLGAELPAGMLRHCIRNMRLGESGWTVPWAMSVDEQYRCYLNVDHSVHHRPGGTVQMRVDRTSRGWEVHIPQGYHYGTHSLTSRDNSVPVATVHRADWHF